MMITSIDPSKIPNRTDILHVCHVDKEKLDNGMASIVDVELKTGDESYEARIDDEGYFVKLSEDSYFHRDHYEIA